MISRVSPLLKTITITILLLFFTVSGAAASLNTTEVEAVLDRVINTQMEELNIPGAALAIVADGEVVLLKGYGYADIRQQTATDPSRTLFRTGSVGKLLTWTAVMQLAEQGQLDLDTDINHYLDFTIPNRLLSGQTAAPITLRHLMTHTAGFEDIKEALFYLSPDKLQPLGETLRTNQAARVFLPGEIVAYSNYGAALAGYIVERTSGLPFSQYVEENIFAPLAMNRSTFRQPLPVQLAPDMARASRYIDNQLVEDTFMYISIEPAGSSSATAADMANFMLAHLQEGRFSDTSILAPDTVRRMHSPQYSPHPEITGLSLGFIDGRYNNQRLLYHGGSTFTFNSGLYLLPEENIGLYITYSGGDFFAPADLFQAFMDHAYPAAYTSPAQDADAASRARAFTGEYHPNRRNFTTDEKILTLMEALHVSVDEEGYLLTTYAGQTSRFAEIAPGVYRNLSPTLTQNPYGTFTTLYFKSDAGNTILFTDGKMSFDKMPWYATAGINASATLLSLLILIFSPLLWLAFSLRRNKLPQTKREKAARWTAATFTFVTLLFLLGTLVSTGETSPLYGVPDSYFGIVPAWSPLISALPKLLALIGAATLAFTAISWRKRFWSLLSRLHYSLFTAAALTLLLLLSQWNLL